eukprot:1482322-Pyramimonas_sp.AAC.1
MCIRDRWYLERAFRTMTKFGSPTVGVMDGTVFREVIDPLCRGARGVRPAPHGAGSGDNADNYVGQRVRNTAPLPGLVAGTHWQWRILRRLVDSVDVKGVCPATALRCRYCAAIFYVRVTSV